MEVYQLTRKQLKYILYINLVIEAHLWMYLYVLCMYNVCPQGTKEAMADEPFSGFTNFL